MLSHSHPRNVLVEKHLIFAEPLSALKLDLLLSVMLFSHEVFQIVNFFHGCPVRSSDRSAIIHFLLKVLSIMLISPNLECIPYSFRPLMSNHGSELFSLLSVCHAFSLVPLELSSDSLIILLFHKVVQIFSTLYLAVCKNQAFRDSERAHSFKTVPVDFVSHHFFKV